MKHSLEVKNLNIKANELSLDIPYLHFLQGSSYCIVGRSGAGKSLLANILAGWPIQDLETSGEVLLNQKAPIESLWNSISFLLPQEPSLALDPTMAVGKQLAQVFKWRLATDCLWTSPLHVGEQVGLSPIDLNKLPTELSGGMQQRAMIAMALVADAAFIIADEPTKGLDEQSKERIIELFQQIRALGRGLIVITHDLDVTRALADNIIVIDEGKIVEQGTVESVLSNANSSATQVLLESEPKNWGQRVCCYNSKNTPVVSLDNVSFGFTPAKAVITNASIDIFAGEIIGLYGPSGVGKSTLADLCLGLQQPVSGKVRWAGTELSKSTLKQQRSMYQKLFQNSVSAFPPNLALSDVFDKLTAVSTTKGPSRKELLEKLGLDESILKRRPHQMSGGELQRLAIVRVLLAQPKFLVCDEPSSRLDMSIQRLAIDTITQYADNTSTAVLLISHDKKILEKRADKIIQLSKAAELSLISSQS